MRREVEHWGSPWSGWAERKVETASEAKEVGRGQSRKASGIQTWSGRNERAIEDSHEGNAVEGHLCFRNSRGTAIGEQNGRRG